MCVSCSVVSICNPLQIVMDFIDSHGPVRLFCPWNSPGNNTGVGCHSLLQGIFPTQGLNPGLLCCRQILYHLSHQGNPYCGYVNIIQGITKTIWMDPKGKITTNFFYLVYFLSINQEKSISECISSVFHTVSDFMFWLPTIFFSLYPFFILAHRMLYYNLSVYLQAKWF